MIPFTPEEAKDLADALGVALRPGEFTTWTLDRTCITGVCAVGLVGYAVRGEPLAAWTYDGGADETGLLTSDEVRGIADGFDRRRKGNLHVEDRSAYRAGHAWGARLRALAGLDGEEAQP